MATLGDALEAATKHQYDETVKLYSDLVTTTYDKASSYLNLITVGGYAAYFGLWSMVHQDITQNMRLWSALLLGISVLLFVGFEIAKVGILHWQLRNMLSIATAKQSNLRSQVEKFTTANFATARVSAGIWLFLYPVTVATGVAGASVLLWGAASKLLSNVG